MPALLFALVGVAYGLIRDEQFTATTEVQVDLPASTPDGLAASLDAGIDFASTYSRAIQAREVVDRVAGGTDLTPIEAAEQLSATPVPDTAVISISGTGSTEAEASAVADTGARALSTYAEEIGDEATSSQAARDVLDDFKEAAREYEIANQDRTEARRVFKDSPDDDAAQERFIEAGVAAESALARRTSLQVTYQESQQRFTAQLESLDIVPEVSSDRLSRLQLLGFAGLVAGFILGAAIALLRSRRASIGR